MLVLTVMIAGAKIGVAGAAIVLVVVIGLGVVLLLTKHDPASDAPRNDTDVRPTAASPDAGDHSEPGETVAREPAEEYRAPQPETSGPSDTYPRSDLVMPFDPADVDPLRGDINPLGVVRFDKDQPQYGHSGIDVPLNQNSPIYAVAAGEIVVVKSADDPWDGMGVWQLLEPTRPGEGWAFVYEHILLAPGIAVGEVLATGDLVGYKAAPSGFTAHFQLSAMFNNYKFSRGMECWPDYLNESASTVLFSWWNVHRASERLIGNWSGNQEDGRYPFRSLLDKSVYPDGPQLCYPPGTDVR
ncbi:hypothetical protein CL628_04120 [bacterium]|nr:hypothetical protein [bacterium]